MTPTPTMNPATTKSYQPQDEKPPAFLFAVAPGWLIWGRKRSEDDFAIYLESVVFIESSGQGAVTELGGNKPAPQTIVSSGNWVPSATITRHSILWWLPTPNAAPESFSPEAKAIAKAK